MSTLAIEIARLAGGIDRPGDFHTSGVREIPAPGLNVEGVGPIALPLLPIQAEQLVAVARRAPYGRGEETVVDTSVRRTWQIDADKVAFGGRNWTRTLEGIVARAAEGLGVDGAVTAELYKLLVYDAGGFFLEHRDTEKVEGMFATLVIVLPSIYDGGELVLRHAGREAVLDLRGADPSEAGFAAFYADCRHEVRPVTSGCRLTLIYNLRHPGRRPEPPAYDGERDRLAARLARWNDEDPLKLVCPLEHAYTPAALSFDALKGADAARVAVVARAAERADCEAHLALLTIAQSGWAEDTGGYRRRGRWDEDDNDDEGFTVGEVTDHTETLSDWRRPDGGECGLGPLPFEEEEISPPDALEDLAPTEQSFREATGNEGASFERTYRLAALVLWPRRHRLAVIAQGGLAATLPALARLVDAVGDDRSLPGWAEAHELSGLMLASWPMDSWRSSKETAPFLDLLGRLGDSGRLLSFLVDVVAAGFEAGDADAVARAIGRLAPERAADVAMRVAAGSASLDAKAALLARCAGFDLRPAAAVMVNTLPGEKPPTDPWGRPRTVTPAIAIDLVTALANIDQALLDQAIGVILAWPRIWDLDRVLIPAVLSLGDTSSRLRDACLAHLNARVALPLAPPADATRDARLTCSCRHCVGLARFLADPDSRSWEFKAVQADRSHVESVVANSKCDVDTATLRKGSPHTLVCTKNQASHERRARQRGDDLALLKRL